MKNLQIIVLLLSVLVPGKMMAQVSVFSPDSMEVKSINNIITSVYGIVSGDAGDRNWDKFKALFLPDASFISIKKDLKGNEVYFNGNVDEYIEQIKPILLENTYYEQETGRSIQESDNIAQVFSMFESILFVEGKPNNLKGANSFQLIFKDNRWWIANVLWNSEPRGY